MADKETTVVPGPELPKIEGMEGMEVTAEDLEVLRPPEPEPDPATEPTKKPAVPEPSVTPAPTVTAEPPMPIVEAPVEPVVGAPAADSPLSDPEKFKEWVGRLDLQQPAREEILGLYSQYVGQRGAIARSNQQRSEATSEAENLRSVVLESEARRRAAEALLHQVRGAAAPPQPTAEPKKPERLQVERDEETGEFYIPTEHAEKFLKSVSPEPETPEPDPAAESRTQLQSEIAAIATRDPANARTLDRLELARQFIASGVRSAVAKFGHQLTTEDDTLRVIQAYRLDEQMNEHYPDVEVEDLMDMVHGGRVLERIVRGYSRKWFPGGRPAGEATGLAPDATPEPAVPGSPTEPAAPAPSATPPAATASPALPLPEKPPTMNRRGGVRPEPDSHMNKLFDQTIDQLVRENPEEVERLMQGAIRELESSTPPN